MASVGYDAYKLSFELSPIMLVDGIATNIYGGMLPIVALTEAVNFIAGLLNGPENLSLDNFFAHFEPMPGATLIEQQIAEYPFANQAVAGNATIQQPLHLAMKMTCPATGLLGYPAKLVTMTALRASLNQHNQLGGTYTIVTPSYLYTNGIMLGMRDIGGQGKQVQEQWQMDFRFPLLTVSEAQSIQNSLMSKLTGGTQTDAQPAWSGSSPTVGAQNSLAGLSAIPAMSGITGGITAPLTGSNFG